MWKLSIVPSQIGMPFTIFCIYPSVISTFRWCYTSQSEEPERKSTTVVDVTHHLLTWPSHLSTSSRALSTATCLSFWDTRSLMTFRKQESYLSVLWGKHVLSKWQTVKEKSLLCLLACSQSYDFMWEHLNRSLHQTLHQFHFS